MMIPLFRWAFFLSLNLQALDIVDEEIWKTNNMFLKVLKKTRIIFCALAKHLTNSPLDENASQSVLT